MQTVTPEQKHVMAFINQANSPLAAARFSHPAPLALHRHDFDELVVVLSGMARHVTTQESYRIGAGDVFLIRRGDPHGYDQNDALQLLNILYRNEALNLPLYDLRDLPGYHAFFELEPELRRRNGYSKHLQVSKKNLEFLQHTGRELERTLAGSEPGRLFTAVAHLMQIFRCICGSYRTAEASKAHEQLWRHSRMLGELQHRWNQPLELEKLARAHGMSPSTLYRWFKGALGQSPQDYLLDLRMDHAREMLVRTRSSICEVAAACGFADSNYFTRCFRQRTGFTPRRYRLEKSFLAEPRQ